MAVATLALLAVVLLVLLLRRTRGDAGAALVGQQLIELRGRIEQLVAAQREVPLELADGRAAQLRTLADVHERLGQLVEATRRLETVGAAVAEGQELLSVPKLRGTLGGGWLAGR